MKKFALLLLLGCNAQTAEQRLAPDKGVEVSIEGDSVHIAPSKEWAIVGEITEWQWDSIRSYAVPVMKADTLILDGIKYGREQVANDWDSMSNVIDSLTKAGL